MRITTRQLKRIIAEEIGRVLEVSAYKHKGKYIVKNRQSGNIYAVSKFRPDHHERVDKEELQAWVAKKRGQHVTKPTGEKAWKRKTTSSAAQKLRAHKAARDEKQGQRAGRKAKREKLIGKAINNLYDDYADAEVDENERGQDYDKAFEHNQTLRDKFARGLSNHLYNTYKDSGLGAEEIWDEMEGNLKNVEVPEEDAANMLDVYERQAMKEVMKKMLKDGKVDKEEVTRLFGDLEGDDDYFERISTSGDPALEDAADDDDDDDDDYPFNYNSDNRVLAHDYGPIGPPRKRKRWTSL